MHKNELSIEQLRAVCPLDVFDFETTDEFHIEEEIIHQRRAVESIDFGLDIKSDGYNIFICGAAGTGRNTAAKKAVREIASKEPIPDDWCYLHNFRHPDEPNAIRLRPGKGIYFK